MANWLLKVENRELYHSYIDNEVDLEYLRVQYYKYINK